MNKLSLVFPLLRILFSEPRAFLKSLYHFTVVKNRQKHVASTYGLPRGFPDVDLMELIPDFEEEVISYTYLDGTSRVIDIALLRALCRKFEDCQYLEIGSWRGESLANVSQIAKEVYSVSLSDAEMKQFGFEKEIKLQRIFSEDLPNVTHIKHNSFTFDFESLNKKFDIVFVDGDHSYEGVKTDTKSAFSLLKDENSLIVWHDYGKNYEGIRWDVMAGILDGAPEAARNQIYHVSNTLCALYTQQDIRSYFPDKPQMPNKTFSLKVKAREFAPVVQTS